MARRERNKGRSSKRSTGRKDREENKSSSRRVSPRRSKKSFQYKKRDPESVKKRSTQGAGNRDQIFLDGFNILKLKEDNNIRILPPTWNDPEHYAFDAFIHYGIGSDESSFICLDKIGSEDKCPICEERAKAEAKGDTEYASSLKPTKRPTCYVIDRDNEDDGALLWAMPWTVDRDLSAQSFDKRSGEVIPLDDPYDGFDVSFSKQGKGLKTKYVGLSIGRHSSEASDDLDDILDFIQENPVPDAFDVKDADYISSVFSGHSKAESGTDDKSTDFSWEEIHDMDFDDMEDLVEDEGLDDIELDDFDEEDELADAICEELDIKKPKKSPKGKARNMRRNRK